MSIALSVLTLLLAAVAYYYRCQWQWLNLLHRDMVRTQSGMYENYDALSAENRQLRRRIDQLETEKIAPQIVAAEVARNTD